MHVSGHEAEADTTSTLAETQAPRTMVDVVQRGRQPRVGQKEQQSIEQTARWQHLA